MQQEKYFSEIGASLLKYFLNFSCDIELKIYTTKYSNLLLIILIFSLNCLHAAHTEKEKF